ncbi:MAG: IS66 family transposase [Chromatiaceae bacterium]|nr:IS66 family transposase [Chromatiaceae bacterium]
MHLSDHDLKQLDEDYLRGLPAESLRLLSGKLLADLKEAHDRLNQNPSNSSRPPSTRPPWAKGDGGEDEKSAPQDAVVEAEAPTEPAQADAAAGQDVKPGSTGPEGEAKPRDEAKPGRPGRRKGAPGVSRTQQLPVDAEERHRPETCAACGAPLGEELEYRPYTARFELDVVPPDGAKCLVLRQTKHIYLETRCHCGHCTRARPGRVPGEAEWTVALSEWYLAGPTLVALICALALRMRLSRARIQEFLLDWLGLELGVATINQCLHEAGRAVDPVVQGEVLRAIRETDLLHADETSWKEGGRLLWLWVFTCASATLFIVGKRTREVLDRVLGESFAQWLMTDGYWAYRDYDWRLRCLAHLMRKARGLQESLDRRAEPFGTQLRTVLDTLMQAVYQARGAPPDTPLREQHAALLTALFHACTQHAESSHAKTRALARELLNDWDTFWVVLDYPWLPLTNNEAEQALRHWVIARRIGNGTRTHQGTRAFANLASIIETCRKRSASPWPYLAEVIRQRRKGCPAPALPTLVGPAACSA